MTGPTRSAFKTLIIAIIVTLGFAAAFVALSYVIEGKTLATRTATSMAMPIGLAWLSSMCFALWFGLRRIWSAGFCFAMICALIYVTGNIYFSSRLMTQLEWPEQDIVTKRDKPFRCVVVLGGGMTVSSLGTPELGADGERIFSAAQLWHSGETVSIICTGATPDGRFNPGDIGKEVLLTTGVPEDVVYVVKGENTTQEMQILKELFQNPPADFPTAGEIALVTSAFHMRRAMRLAEAEGLEFVPFPCAFRTTVFGSFEPSRWIPVSEGTGNFALALKERLGMLVGR